MVQLLQYVALFACLFKTWNSFLFFYSIAFNDELQGLQKHPKASLKS